MALFCNNEPDPSEILAKSFTLYQYQKTDIAALICKGGSLLLRSGFLLYSFMFGFRIGKELGNFQSTAGLRFIRLQLILLPARTA